MTIAKAIDFIAVPWLAFLMYAGRFGLGRLSSEEYSFPIGIYLALPLLVWVWLRVGREVFTPLPLGILLWFLMLSGIYAEHTDFKAVLRDEIVLLVMLALCIPTILNTPFKGRMFVSLIGIAAFALAFASVVTDGGDGYRRSALTMGAGVFGRNLAMGAVAYCFVFGKDKGWVLLPMACLFAMILLSGSRAVWLASTIGLSVFGITAFTKAWWNLRRCALIGVLVVVGFGLAWVIEPGFLHDRLVDKTINERYTSGRTHMAREAVRLIQENPVIGVGLGSYSVLSEPAPSSYGPEWAGPDLYPHNLFLDFGVTLGIPGLVAVIAIMVWMIRKALMWPMTPLRAALWALFAVQFTAQFFSGTFLDGRWMWMFLILLVTIPGEEKEHG